MDHSCIDAYGVLAGILTIVLSVTVPFMSFKYQRVLAILRECKVLLRLIRESWQDREISREEIKMILTEAEKIVDHAIGGTKHANVDTTCTPSTKQSHRTNKQRNSSRRKDQRHIH